MSTAPHPASLPGRAVLLDALGTLVELRPPAPALRGTLAQRFGVLVTESEAAAGVAAEIAYYREHLDDGRDGRSLQSLRHHCTEVLREALPRARGLEAVSDEALTEALLASLRFRAFPDAKPALQALRADGRRIVVVSNWDCSLHGVLAHLSLTPMLDGIVTSAEAGARKPAPEIFTEALGLAGASPERAVHVGDSLEEDVAGARAAGITPVLLARAGLGASREVSAPAGVGVIRSLNELAPPSGSTRA